MTMNHALLQLIAFREKKCCFSRSSTWDQVFARYGVANGVLFTLKHIYQRWLYPAILVGGLTFAFAAGPLGSLPLAMAFHWIGNFLIQMVFLFQAGSRLFTLISYGSEGDETFFWYLCTSSSWFAVIANRTESWKHPVLRWMRFPQSLCYSLSCEQNTLLITALAKPRWRYSACVPTGSIYPLRALACSRHPTQ